MAPSLFALLRSPFSPGSKFSDLLRTYFRSGWAFFIPYLAAYLLYAWLDGPVNPGKAGGGSIEGISESGSTKNSAFSLQFSAFFLPSLLHVYWGLHAIHAILGGLALASLWRGGRKERGVGSRNEKEISAEPSKPCPDLQSSICQHPSALQPFSLSALQKSAPWLLLALIFWIPGLYLEWPSDPWEHLRRINEWHAQDTVTNHSSWKKSSYFLPYSLTQHATGLAQLSWLNLYYTAICLLLSWQHFLLARAVGLGPRASFIVALLNALTFGNSIFSFHRYYGLSSTAISAIAYLACLRMLIEQFRPSTLGGQKTTGRTSSFPQRQPAPNRGRALGAAAATLLVSWSHPQGLGWLALSAAAVAAWKLTARGWSSVLGACAVCLVASLGVVLLVPVPEALRAPGDPAGWLGVWYGFDLLSPASPASARAWQILGALGAASIAASLWLVRKNLLAGWLGLLPAVALMFPVIAVPFGILLYERGAETVVAFHRMLLAAPAGLALVVAANLVLCRPKDDPLAFRPWRHLPSLHIQAGLPTAAVGLLVLLPSTQAGYNRIWHLLHQAPSDLGMRRWIDLERLPDPSAHNRSSELPMRTLWGPAGAMGAMGEPGVVYGNRLIQQPPYFPPAERFEWLEGSIAALAIERRPAVIFVPHGGLIVSPYSLAGRLSHHWLAQEVALEHAARRELLHTLAAWSGENPDLKHRVISSDSFVAD